MFTIKEILEATDGVLTNQNIDNNLIVKGVSIDSRTLKAADLFIAIRGDNFNGHDYILSAVKKGADAVLIENSWAEKNIEDLKLINQPIILVENSIAALACLAKKHRKKFSIPVIAVTGSNGKTTTKDMIACVLEAKYKVLKSKGSFNNHIGVPLTLLELDSTHQAAVIEMGMNHKGEIRGLASIALPAIGVITNAAQAHIEFFNSISDIIEAKCELLEMLSANSIAVVNVDCKPLYARAKNFGIDIVDFGIKSACAYQGSNIIGDADGTAFTVNEKYTFRINILGEHNVYNALAAIAIAQYFKIDYALIREQLLKFQPVALRMQTIKCRGLSIIADCYNANPDSTMAAINTLIAIKGKAKKIFVLGNMLELGVLSNQAHQQIGKFIAGSSIAKLITVGQKAAYAAQAASDCGMSSEDIYQCETNEAVAVILEKISEQGDIVLLKGSRAMHLEQIIDCLNTKLKE